MICLLPLFIDIYPATPESADTKLCAWCLFLYVDFIYYIFSYKQVLYTLKRKLSTSGKQLLTQALHIRVQQMDKQNGRQMKHQTEWKI